jgi:hypothetical protein
MLAQVINKAIPIFEKAYPDHIAVFAFDNSSGHACKAEDVLVASRINVNPVENNHSCEIQPLYLLGVVFPRHSIWSFS